MSSEALSFKNARSGTSRLQEIPRDVNSRSSHGPKLAAEYSKSSNLPKVLAPDYVISPPLS